MLKRTVLFIGFMVCGLLSPAQQTDILISEDFQGTPLIEVLHHIEKEYQLQLAYDPKAVEGIMISQQFVRLPLEAVLSQLLEPHGIDFLLLSPRRAMIRPAGQAAAPGRLFLLRGRIVDAFTQAPLPFATIWAEDAGRGAAADEQGFFEIELPPPLPSTLDLEVRFLGYNPGNFHLPLTTTDRLPVLRLSPRAEEISLITVTEVHSSSPAAAGLATDGRPDTALLAMLPAPLGQGGLLRQIQFLPGISAHDGRDASLRIRGSDETENLVLLDGIPLYSVSHFYGIFSRIDEDALQEAELFRNAFPAEYGGRTAGVVALESRLPDTNRMEGHATIESLLARAYLGIPVNNKMQVAVAGRLTSRDVADSPFFGRAGQEASPVLRFGGRVESQSGTNIIGMEPDFHFYDGHLRWNWRPSPASQWSATIFRSYDALQYDYQTAFSQQYKGRTVQNTESYQEKTAWAHNGSSLRWRAQWSPTWQSNLLLSYSAFRRDASIAASLRQAQPGKTDTSHQLSYADFNRVEGVTFHWKNRWSHQPGQYLKAGYQFAWNHIGYRLLAGMDKQLLADGQQTAEHVFYTEYHRQLRQRLAATFGLRNTFYSGLDRWFISPRLHLSYTINPHWQVNGAGSRYFQFLRTVRYEDPFGRNFNFWALANNQALPVAEARQGMLGIQWSNNGWEAGLEFYDKHTNGRLLFALPRPGFGMNNPAPQVEGYQLFEGKGRTIGLDFLLRKNAGPFSGWLAYTFSKASQQFPEINEGEPFPAPEDRRHQLKWASTYKWKHWEFSAAFIFASGIPYFDLSRLGSQQSRFEGPINLYIVQLRAYQRMDAGLIYHLGHGRFNGSAGLTVLNLFDADNVALRQYTYSIPAQGNSTRDDEALVLGAEQQLLPRTLNLKFSVEF